jgi:CMP-N-acetylneuraminate monooxygenase
VHFLKSFKNLPLRYRKIKAYVDKNIDEIQEGASQDDNFLYFRLGENIKVYDRVCNHSGGRLFIKGKNASCPLHGWDLNLSNGFYTNVRFTKKPVLEINEYELDSPLISVPKSVEQLCVESWITEKTTELRFINHACLIFKVGDISFATDPWITGSAFCNGWWLAKPSPKDAFDELNKCDFIYISHNHPDHLHPESLDKIRKDMPILTADFISGSTKEYLTKLGFSDVVAMDFSTALVDTDREICLSVLKSGDFRDDSGLFVQHGNFKCLLTVDSNFLNFFKFPEVDLLCSSFAGGASGFPLCFEIYTEQEKKAVVTRNREAIKTTNSVNLKATKAKYFMPYAGFFIEAATRDLYIKERNFKNSVEDFHQVCKVNDATLINVNEEQIFVFEGAKLTSERVDRAEKMASFDEYIYLNYDSKIVDKELSEKVLKYFAGCSFNDDLLLDLIPTNDDFSESVDLYRLDFKNNDYSHLNFENCERYSEKDALERGLRYLQIKARKAELLDIFSNGKPWEDISIGFQCRIYRTPNIYNSKFWFYFTNVYIGGKVTSKSVLEGINPLK